MLMFEIEEKEMVDHPSHYNQGIETIEYIESWSMNFNTGNVIKYVTRAGYKDNQLEVDRRTLHSSDVALVLNELRAAGAEGIAINNYRVLNTTGVQCAWAFIRFDDKKIEGSPFKFYALGNPDQLQASLLLEGSHINELKIRKLNITIEKFEEIELPTAKKSIEPSFMQRADN